MPKANAAKKYDTRRKAFAISRLLNYCDLKHMRETPHPSAFGCHLLPLEKAIKNAVSLTEIMSPERLRRFFFGTAGAKKKLCKKKAPFGGFRPLRRATKGSAFGNRKPLKRLDLNFKKANGDR